MIWSKRRIILAFHEDVEYRSGEVGLRVRWWKCTSPDFCTDHGLNVVDTMLLLSSHAVHDVGVTHSCFLQGYWTHLTSWHVASSRPLQRPYRAQCTVWEYNRNVSTRLQWLSTGHFPHCTESSAAWHSRMIGGGGGRCSRYSRRWHWWGDLLL